MSDYVTPLPDGWPRLSPTELLAQRGTPVVDAMRYWVAGDVSVPSLAEFFDRFGNRYRDHLRTMFDRDGTRGLLDARGLVASATDSLAVHMERDRFISEFSFAVPTREALDRICQFSPLLEIGAGSGAWAKLLAMRGADIIATDPALETYGLFFGKDGVPGRWARFYYPILPLAGKTAVRHWRTRNVFCSWPSYDRRWLRQAARAMLPGRVLIVVREDATADERTWDYVEHHFKPVVNYVEEIRAGGLEVGHWVDNRIELPNWHFLHDRLEVWQKKTRRELAATPPPEKDDELADDPDDA